MDYEEEAGKEEEANASGAPKQGAYVGVNASGFADLLLKEELTKVGICGHFPVVCWPPCEAVNQLATWAKTARKYKSKRAYVYADTKR